jgi:pentose-5-phosphate-3-epimerase
LQKAKEVFALLEIVPSLASANQSCLKDEIEKLGKDTVKEIHLDKAHCLQGNFFFRDFFIDEI